jgi:hypothetical protein
VSVAVFGGRVAVGAVVRALARGEQQVPFGKLRACPEPVEGAGSHRACSPVRNDIIFIRA